MDISPIVNATHLYHYRGYTIETSEEIQGKHKNGENRFL